MSEPIVSDRSQVIEGVKKVIPRMQNSTHPEAELLAFAKENNLAPEMLGSIAKAINTLKTQSIYASAKTPEERGKSFSTIDVPSLLAQYETPEVKKVASIADDFMFDFTAPMKKAASEKHEESEEEDIKELFEDEFKPNKESEEIADKFFAEEPKLKLASAKPEYKHTFQDYLDLSEELHAENAEILNKFAKYFNPQNINRKYAFYELEQIALDNADISDEVINKIAADLKGRNLEDIKTLDDKSKEPVWGVSYKRASNLAKDINSLDNIEKDLVEGIIEFNRNNVILKQAVASIEGPRTEEPIMEWVHSDGSPTYTSKPKPKARAWQPTSRFHVNTVYVPSSNPQKIPQPKAEGSSFLSVAAGLTEAPFGSSLEKSLDPYKDIWSTFWNSKPQENPVKNMILDEINDVKSEEFFNDLMFTDSVLSKLNESEQRELADIYQAAKDLYPDIAKNRSVLKTFLRQAVETSGMDVNTMGMLAKVNKDSAKGDAKKE